MHSFRNREHHFKRMVIPLLIGVPVVVKVVCIACVNHEDLRREIQILEAIKDAGGHRHLPMLVDVKKVRALVHVLKKRLVVY